MIGFQEVGGLLWPPFTVMELTRRLLVAYLGAGAASMVPALAIARPGPGQSDARGRPCLPWLGVAALAAAPQP